VKERDRRGRQGKGIDVSCQNRGGSKFGEAVVHHHLEALWWARHANLFGTAKRAAWRLEKLFPHFLGGPLPDEKYSGPELLRVSSRRTGLNPTKRYQPGQVGRPRRYCAWFSPRQTARFQAPNFVAKEKIFRIENECLGADAKPISRPFQQ